MKNIRPIRNEDDYNWALAEVERYFEQEPELGTPEADRFDVLADLIAAYENRHWPIEDPEPIDALKCFMQDTGRTEGELARLLGSPSRASEVLSRKRALTVAMIHKLHAEWKIPANLLTQPYALDVPDSASEEKQVVG